MDTKYNRDMENTILDGLKHYVNRILYDAHTKGAEHTHRPSEFDQWVEKQVNGIDDFFRKTPQSYCTCSQRSLSKPMSETEFECFDCGKEIAPKTKEEIVTEPYFRAKVINSDEWVTGFFTKKQIGALIVPVIEVYKEWDSGDYMETFEIDGDTLVPVKDIGYYEENCVVCNGSGQIKFGRETCDNCQGKGHLLIMGEKNASDYADFYRFAIDYLKYGKGEYSIEQISNFYLNRK